MRVTIVVVKKKRKRFQKNKKKTVAKPTPIKKVKTPKVIVRVIVMIAVVAFPVAARQLVNK